MKFEFIPTDEFAKELKKLAKKYNSLKSEIEELQKNFYLLL
jgi:mRNA-degrading endonuclease RelE of RelBE toxin-antitoxin system